MQFPEATYKQYTLNSHSESLGPETAIAEADDQNAVAIQVLESHDGYAAVLARGLATRFNIPFGWDFRVDSPHSVTIYPGALGRSDKDGPVEITLQALDGGAAGADFNTFREAVGALMTTLSADNAATEVSCHADEPLATFVFERRGLNARRVLNPNGSYHIYVHDPTPNSTVWFTLSLRAPEGELNHYLGLLGLIYREMKTDWYDLERRIEYSKELVL
jgi:hypothetical protein